VEIAQQIEAISRVHKARTALERCRSAGDDHAQFKLDWEFFLVSLKGVYSFLEQATKGHPKLTPWFGQIRNARRTDMLLQYLQQARDAEEHGILPVVKMQRKTTFSNPSGGTVDINHDAFGRPTYKITPNNGERLQISSDGPKVVLASVTTRSGTYPPPTSHLGLPIEDPSPLIVGQLGLEYYDRAVKEANRIANGQA
jgi:hypothetical protein